ncbi:MAG: hypothetical protein ABI604_20695 [Nitrospirota bacterium]
MKTRPNPRLAEALETCRPTSLNTPNILKELLVVQFARGYVSTNAIP